LLSAVLQDLQELQSRDSGEAVSMNRNLLAAMNDINVIPRFKVPRDCSVRTSSSAARRLAKSFQKTTPHQSVVGSIPLVDFDLMIGIGLFHEDREVQPRWPAADDVDVHCYAC
jgi:hypothetical protein